MMTWVTNSDTLVEPIPSVEMQHLCTCSTITIDLDLPFIAEQFLLILDTVQLQTASTLASVND